MLVKNDPTSTVAQEGVPVRHLVIFTDPAGNTRLYIDGVLESQEAKDASKD